MEGKDGIGHSDYPKLHRVVLSQISCWRQGRSEEEHVGSLLSETDDHQKSN
jgi:hypothetical protein